MRIVQKHEVEAARPFLCAFENQDGTVTLYYPGDTIPDMSPTPEQVAAAEAARLKDEQDAAAIRSHVKLTALKNMNPAQIQAWVTTNVTNLAQAQDAISTLAVGVSILARKI